MMVEHFYAEDLLGWKPSFPPPPPHMMAILNLNMAAILMAILNFKMAAILKQQIHKNITSTHSCGWVQVVLICTWWWTLSEL